MMENGKVKRSSWEDKRFGGGVRFVADRKST